MGSKHLEGWRVSAGDELTVFDGGNVHIAKINCGGMTGRNFEQGADMARLIAAAPDLLTALDGLVSYLKETPHHNATQAAAARAAIAKAKGVA